MGTAALFPYRGKRIRLRNEGQDIGAGKNATGVALPYRVLAAVFLRNGVANSLTPNTATHSPTA
jgi:hypothetical protein